MTISILATNFFIATILFLPYSLFFRRLLPVPLTHEWLSPLLLLPSSYPKVDLFAQKSLLGPIQPYHIQHSRKGEERQIRERKWFFGQKKLTFVMRKRDHTQFSSKRSHLLYVTQTCDVTTLNDGLGHNLDKMLTQTILNYKDKSPEISILILSCVVFIA